MPARTCRGEAVATDASSDEQLVVRAVDGELDAFTTLMRRHNPRLYRMLRGVVRDDAEAEDACQEAWLRAYQNLGGLHDRSMFSSWLCRIALRCALARVQYSRALVSLDEVDRREPDHDDSGPEREFDNQRLAATIERAIDELPPSYRTIVVLRDVELMSTLEIAELLGVSMINVRVRLHRARASLRRRLVGELGNALAEVFHCDGERSLRLTGAVLAHVRAPALKAAG